MKLKRNGWLLLALFGLLFMASAPNAMAVVELQLTVGTTTITVVDGGSGDLCGATDCVTFSGTIGGWSINVDTGVSGTNPNFLDLNYDSGTKSNNPGTLTIAASDNNFTPTAGGFTFDAGGTNALLGGSVQFQAFASSSNLLFDTTNPVVAPTMTFGTGAYSNTVVGSGLTTGPYSMTIVETVTCTTCSQGRQFNVQTGDSMLTANPVPEPAAVTLLGGLLLLVGGAIRRRTLRVS